jgi:hypothetical protein
VKTHSRSIIIMAPLLLLLVLLACLASAVALLAPGAETVPSSISADTIARVSWFRSCHAQVAPRPRADAETDAAVAHGLLLDRDALRAHGYWVYAQTAHVRRGVKPADLGFFTGPWLENVWIDSFTGPNRSAATATKTAAPTGGAGAGAGDRLHPTTARARAILDVCRLRDAAHRLAADPAADHQGKYRGQWTRRPRTGRGSNSTAASAEALAAALSADPEAEARRVAACALAEKCVAPDLSADDEAACADGGMRGGGGQDEEGPSSPSPVVPPYDADLFHPFVPLFLNWEDLGMHFSGLGLAVGAAWEAGSPLLRLLRDDVLYVTVTQRHTAPIASEFEPFAPLFKNILVLAAGGHAPVPLPLLAREQPLLFPPDDVDDEKAGEAASRRWREAKWALSFVGSMREGVREQIGKTISASPRWKGSFLQAKFAANNTDGWVDVMASSRFQLTPRGVNPTSFRLYEVLQMGLVPIYVCDGAPYLPYHPYFTHPLGRNYASPPMNGTTANSTGAAASAPTSPFLWDEIGFVVHARDFPRWLEEDFPLIHADEALHVRMRRRIRGVRGSLFTYAGVMERIRELFADPFTALLQCAPRT